MFYVQDESTEFTFDWPKVSDHEAKAAIVGARKERAAINVGRNGRRLAEIKLIGRGEIT